MVSLDQGNSRIDVQSATRAEDGTVRITLPRIQASFEGKMSEDGSKLEGTWNQGVEFPLVFHRVKGK